MTTEDSQPNEALKQPKGSSIVPAVRTSQPPKWHPTYKGNHRGGTPQRGYWHRQTPQPRLARTTDAIPCYQFQRHNAPAQMHMLQYRNHSSHSSAAPISTTSTSSGPLLRSPLSRDRPNTQSGSSQPNSSSSHPSDGMQAPKRQTREWQLVDSGPTKRRKKTGRKFEELRLDLPPECRKDATQHSHFKGLFLAQLRNGLKETMDAEIIQHRFTDAQLFITYHIPEPFGNNKSDSTSVVGAHANPNIKPSIPSGSNIRTEGLYQSASPLLSSSKYTSTPQTVKAPVHTTSSKGTGGTRIVVSTPSGSDVKLEDLYESVSYLLDTTKDVPTRLPLTPERASLSKGSGPSPTILQAEEMVVAPRQIRNRPRPFRSGLVALSYGLPGSPRRTASSPLEDVEIYDTPPSYPQLKIVPRDDSHMAIRDIESPRSSPQTNVEELSEVRVKSESGIRMEPFLEEETSTIVHLPRASGDKPRRILVSYVQDMVYSTTMHGFVQEIEMKSKRYTRELHMPVNADKGSVEDVCLFVPPFDNLAVVAQVHEEHSLSLLHLGEDEKHRVTPVARISLDRDRQRRGVSAVATLPTSSSLLSFISAGYDHTMHLWSFEPTTAFEQPPVAGILDVRHTSVVQSLLSVGDRLISGGADNCVRTWDLRAAQALSTIRTSNSVYQLHRTANPESVLIEVGHRDSQFELHDCRLSSDGRPPLRFGYASVQGAHGRYIRGAVDPRGWSTFVSGGRDGMIRLWDLRNLKQCKQEIMCFPGQKIVHATFAWDNLIIASDDNRLLFFDFARM